jgi:hypothetical protein
MNNVRLKEKKIIENYLERVKAGERGNGGQKIQSFNNINHNYKEARATATSHSKEKGYINQS